MQNLPITIKINDKILKAVIENSETGRDFYNLLPITLTLSDYHNTEKISDLPKKLTTKNAPSGMKPQKGDITYYAPWGNLAIFYQKFRYSSGLIKLGHIIDDVSPLLQNNDFTATLSKDS